MPDFSQFSIGLWIDSLIEFCFMFLPGGMQMLIMHLPRIMKTLMITFYSPNHDIVSNSVPCFTRWYADADHALAQDHEDSDDHAS